MKLRGFVGGRDARGDSKRDALDLGAGEGEPKRSKDPGEQRIPLRINPLESDK
jgi:hypothetical protein